MPPVVTTLTDSEKATSILMESPTVYVPLDVDDVTPLIVGRTASIINELFAASEPEAPGDARVSVASLPAASLIVPLFKARAEVEA